MSRRYRWLLIPTLAVATAACPFQADPVTPQAAKDSAAAGPARSTRTPPPRDSVAERRIARLELRLAERDAQVQDLQDRLDDARQEVVRALAKLQTVASRAEAASVIAEAEIAVQALRAAAGAQQAPDVAQAGRLLEQASTEFAKQNYGGALYLANQAKSLAGVGRSRLAGADRAALRPGEVSFVVPVRLLVSARGKVRDGPGAAYKVLYTVEPGAAVVGYSYLEQWVRVADGSGRAGWILLTQLARRGTEPAGR